MRALATTVVVVALSAVAAEPPADAPATTDPPTALTGAAVQAVDQKSYCDALALFLAMNARWPSARALYNSAEVAYAAGDRWRAVELYRDAQRLYPDYEKKGVLQQRLDELGKKIARDGPGNACAEKKNACGDWRLEGAETCDDGNTVSGDGCDVFTPTNGASAICVTTTCGNNVLTPGESCDDGNLVNGDGCDANCTATSCGNGVLTPGEKCDDSNVTDGDGCDHNCMPTICGNGVKTDGEQCDDGNQKDGDGCDDGCVLTRCGNGVRTGVERCDDGNNVNGDGCDNDCSVSEEHAPIPGILTAAGGALAVGGSIGLFWAAGDVWARHEQAAALINAKEAEYKNDPTTSLSTLDEAHAQEAETRTAWEGWGRVALGAGTFLSIGGLAAIGGGVYWAITRTVTVEPSEDTQ